LAALVTSALAGAPPPAQSAHASTQAPRIRFVTQDPEGIDYGPQFSPDSQRLVFERSPLAGGKEEAYAVPLSGGVPKPLLKEPLDVRQTRLRWSPAGDRIAFTGTAPDHSSTTWLMDADGSHAHPAYASSGKHFFMYPSWYPDGTRIAEMDADATVIRVVDLHTGKATPLAFRPSLMTGMASVSPDGRTIAVAAQENHGQDYDQKLNRIWLISDQGKARPLEPDALQGRAPTWSPDGAKIVFESGRDSPQSNDYAIYVADRYGTHVRRLTPLELDAQHPVWSPDGRWIAFSARQAKAHGKFDTGIAIIAAPD
jgi:Tol biopolymer transport system component